MSRQCPTWTLLDPWTARLAKHESSKSLAKGSGHHRRETNALMLDTIIGLGLVALCLLVAIAVSLIADHGPDWPDQDGE